MHVYIDACLPTSIYTFRIQYFQISGISVFVSFKIYENPEILEFLYSVMAKILEIWKSWNFHIFVVAEILEISKY